jgi:hypothetical protein
MFWFALPFFLGDVLCTLTAKTADWLGERCNAIAWHIDPAGRWLRVFRWLRRPW